MNVNTFELPQAKAATTNVVILSLKVTKHCLRVVLGLIELYFLKYPEYKTRELISVQNITIQS